MKLRDIVVMLMVLVVLALLAWLFLHPVEPERQIVFGELGRRASQTNAVAASSNPLPSNITGVTNANFPRTNESSQAFNEQSNRPAESMDGAVIGSNSNATANSSASMGSNTAVANSATANSNSAVTGPFTNDVSQNGSPATLQNSQTPAMSSNSMAASSPSPSAVPSGSPAPAQGFSSNSAVYDDPWRAEPSSRASTARLLDEAKSAEMAGADSAPNRTADMLNLDTASRWWFDPRAGSNVVFILDNSMNMLTGGKSFSARQELVGALRAMNASQLFYVLLFHSGGYEGMPSLAPIPASPENVQSMTNWLFSVGHRPGADPSKAMRRALGLAPAPDVVWMLSGSTVSNNVVGDIREANAGPNARVNTVDLYTRDGERTLREIADENRGVYHFVPSPHHLSAPPP